MTGTERAESKPRAEGSVGGEMTPKRVAFVVPAPGHYGDETRVLSAHYSTAAALRAARRMGGAVARRGSMVRGDRWLRVYEETYPVVEVA